MIIERKKGESSPVKKRHKSIDVLKKEFIAILFSSGRRLDVIEFSEICNVASNISLKILKEIKEDYDKNSNSLIIMNDGEFWKMTVREEYSSYVSKIVKETEMPKSLMETLALIAYRHPIKQSEVIKIRTGEAYKHITELIDLGFISKKIVKNISIIDLSDKFYDYFRILKDDLDNFFDGFDKVELAIKEHEDKSSQLMKIIKEEKRKLKMEKIEMEKKSSNLNLDLKNMEKEILGEELDEPQPEPDESEEEDNNNIKKDNEKPNEEKTKKEG